MQAYPKKQTLHGIEYLNIPIKNLETSQQDFPDKVILLHGYGASMEDLFPLAHILDPLQKKSWTFPNGVLPLNMGPWQSGKAWFPIDRDYLEKIDQGKSDFSLEDLSPPGFIDAINKMAPMLKDIADNKKLILGGFSQGAMMATHLALQFPDLVSKLVILSGHIVNQKSWEHLLESNLPKWKSFVSHGTQDPILKFSGALSIVNLLHKYQIPVEFHRFQGGHDIPGEVLQELKKFIEDES